MKFRHVIIIASLALFVAACNFTLAADVTPPPGYVAPTAMPTLGPLFPASAPDVTNGAAIYVEKCAACHGDTGFGDGEQGKQLPVTVPAFALPETALKASPAGWFTIVSQGNLDRFMPPFTSLSDQERWDVVSYALTLHTTPEQIETGRGLVASNCADCAEKFSDQKMMAALSANDLIRIIKNGDGDIPAFGSAFTDEEAVVVAAYLRTLTFAVLTTPAPVAATETLTSSEETAQPEVTPEAAISGNVSGSIDNQTGAPLPPDLKVILRGLEHGSDPNAGPQQIVFFEGTVNSDGAYLFENIELPQNRLYLAEVVLDGITYQSEYTVVEAGMTGLELAPITVHATTDDYSVLQIDALQMYFDFANEESVQILAVYSIMNTSDKTVIVKLDETQKVPFIEMPNNAASIGYEASPDSAPFVPLVDGFAMQPSETSYGLIAFASLPKADEIEIDQPAVLPIAEVMLLLPAGVTASGETLANNGPHEFQGGTFNMYTSTTGVAANESISFTLSGEPGNTTVAPNIFQNQTLVIGAGLLGIALILAGTWMYLRDRNYVREGDGQGNELDDPDSVMDSIIALDDLHRAGKLSDDAYKARRNELKNTLKRKS
jgi:mono/diheme cytochrome c family protein